MILIEVGVQGVGVLVMVLPLVRKAELGPKQTPVAEQVMEMMEAWDIPTLVRVRVAVEQEVLEQQQAAVLRYMVALVVPGNYSLLLRAFRG